MIWVPEWSVVKKVGSILLVTTLTPFEELSIICTRPADVKLWFALNGEQGVSCTTSLPSSGRSPLRFILLSLSWDGLVSLSIESEMLVAV